MNSGAYVVVLFQVMKILVKRGKIENWLKTEGMDNFFSSFFLQLHSKLLETERQLGEAHGRLKEQRQLSSEKLMDKEQQVADLQLKLSRAEEQVGAFSANFCLYCF